MTEQLPMDRRFGLGPIDQISFAVRNLDEALPRYTAMFGGPLRVMDVPGLEVVVGGVPTSATLRIGFGSTGPSGDIEVELVEVVSGDWPTLAWLDEHGEGLHHVRYPVDDLAAVRAELVAAGFEVLLEEPNDVFAYLASPLLNGMAVELISLSTRDGSPPVVAQRGPVHHDVLVVPPASVGRS
jgi:methylmalonyl-CoA/ethylmalonyl-CoA epimerase